MKTGSTNSSEDYLNKGETMNTPASDKASKMLDKEAVPAGLKKNSMPDREQKSVGTKQSMMKPPKNGFMPKARGR